MCNFAGEPGCTVDVSGWSGEALAAAADDGGPTAFVAGPGIDGVLDVSDWSEDDVADLLDPDMAGVTVSNHPIPDGDRRAATPFPCPEPGCTVDHRTAVERYRAEEPDAPTVNAVLVALGRARSAADALEETLAHHRRRHAAPVEAFGPSGWVDVAVLAARVRAELDRIGPLLDGAGS